MKKNIVILFSLVSMLALSGCGSSSDPLNDIKDQIDNIDDSVSKVKDNKKEEYSLEARELPYNGNGDNIYFGECVYDDGFSTPLIIELDSDYENYPYSYIKEHWMKEFDSRTWPIQYRDKMDKTAQTHA
ncbi:MAG: hypothetical protein DSZ06_03170 [Sulfurospirillum sp.]|nr:MAG: hypothetical protein DSZ06_03170 [Sulfurospirillum sp.]